MKKMENWAEMDDLSQNYNCEKHHISDDEKCKSPKMTDRKRARWLTRELMEDEEDTHSGFYSNEFQPEKYGSVCSELLSLVKPEGVITESDVQRSRSGAGNSGSTLVKEQKETETKDSEDILGLFFKLKERTLTEAEVGPEIREQFEHVESRLKAMKLDGKRNCDFPVVTTTDRKRLDDNSNETETAMRLTKDTSGLWMCKVASELSKTDSLRIATLLKFGQTDRDKINESPNPALELLHAMKKQDLIGPNGENLHKIFSELDFSSAAYTLKKSKPMSPPSPVPQRHYAFEKLIKDLEQILDRGDAERVATYFKFSNTNLFEVKTNGAPCLLKKLKEMNFLSSRCVRRVAEALKCLQLSQACLKVEKFEKQSQLPRFEVKLTSNEIKQDPEHQRTENYIEKVFSEMTLADKEDEFKSKVEELSAYVLETFGLSIEGISRGCIILHIRVSSVTYLDQLVMSINSGEFAKACSSILFPHKELELHGLGEKIDLAASYDISSIEKIKAVLETSEYASMEVRLDAKRTNTNVCQPRNIQGISYSHGEDSNHDDTSSNSRGDTTRTNAIEKPIAQRWNVALIMGLSQTFIGDFKGFFAGSHSLKHQVNRFILFQVDDSITVVGAGVLPTEAGTKHSIFIVRCVSSHKVLSKQGSMESNESKYLRRFLQRSKMWNMEKSSGNVLKTEDLGKDPEKKSSENVSKTEDLGKDQEKESLYIPSGCSLQNLFWFPCTSKLARRFLAIEETVKGDMLNYFKEHFTDRGVYMVPPLSDIRFPIKKKGIAKMSVDFPVCDKQIEDNQYLSKNQKVEILRKRIADRTVYEAAGAISKWADDLELDVFIFVNYQYSNYLKNITIATDVDGQFGILVISRDFGVIFIQVSSSMGKSRKVVKQQLQKKTQQLMKDKLVFLESNRDLSDVTSKMPVYQLAAFPNYHRELLELDVCNCHRQGVLTKECFDSDNIFGTLNEKISIPPEPCLSERDYQYLCSRYVGKASNVNTRTAVDGIKTTFKILKKAFLTSEQRQILNKDDLHIVLAGDYGTGKSLILVQKAVRFAKNVNCKPCLISCAHLQCFGGLQTTFENKACGHLSLTKQKLDNLGPNIATFSVKYCADQKHIQQSVNKMFVSMLRDLFTQDMEEKVHILLDEFPFVIIKENPNILESLLESIPDGSYLWLSITTVSSTEREFLENLHSWQNFNSKRFTFIHLEKIMRIPKNVVNLYNSVQEFVGGKIVNKTTGHVVVGPKPMLFSLDNCSCKEINKTPLTCSCVKSRLITALQNVMKVTGNIHPDSISFYIHSFTMLDEIFELLSEAMKSLNYSLVWWFNKESNDTECITVLTENAYLGCESAVVVSVDPFSMNHWAAGIGERAVHTSVFSRCLSQYIHLVWPKQEAEELFEVELKELEQDLRSAYLDARKIKGTGPGRNTENENSCLEYLKAADLFIAGSQYECK